MVHHLYNSGLYPFCICVQMKNCVPNWMNVEFQTNENLVADINQASGFMTFEQAKEKIFTLGQHVEYSCILSVQRGDILYKIMEVENLNDPGDY